MNETAEQAGSPVAEYKPHDALVLAIARDRDNHAFVTLYRHYAPRVKSYVMRLGGSDVAEETAQEVMLTIWRKAALFDPEKASAGTWIYRIARNCYIDRCRKERRPEVDPGDPLLVHASAEPTEAPLLAAQSEQRVRAALRGLPPDQAKVIEMSFFEDKPHAAIAAEMNLPLGTVKSRLRLAFGRLRKALGDTQ